MVFATRWVGKQTFRRGASYNSLHSPGNTNHARLRIIYSSSTGLPYFISHEPQAPTEQLAQTAASRSPPALLPRLPGPGHPTRAAIDDWDLLLTALSIRLRSGVAQHPSSSATSTQARRIEHVVRGCAEDLELLHVALPAESVQRRKLEFRLSDSNDAVIRAIADVGEPPIPAKSTAVNRGL